MCASIIVIVIILSIIYGRENAALYISSLYMVERMQIKALLKYNNAHNVHITD